MLRTDILSRRLAFLGIDAETYSDLRNARTTLEPAIDELLEEFYSAIRVEPEVERLLADPEVADRARAAQKQHWLGALLAGDYDASFVEKAERIGATHARVGLTLSWYLGGYCRMLVQFAGVLGKSAAAPATRLIQAMCKAIFLDVDLVTHCYLDAKDHDMRAIMHRATDLTSDLRTLTDDLRAAVTNARQAAEDIAASASSPTPAPQAELLAHLSVVERHTEQIAARLGALQFGDKLFIDDGAQEPGTFRRLKSLLRGGK